MLKCSPISVVLLSLVVLDWVPAGSDPARSGRSLVGVAFDYASPPDKQGRKERDARIEGATNSSATVVPMGSRAVVVVSTKNPIESLTVAELARIYLRKKTQWPNGWSITVFERPTKEPIRQAFSDDVLGTKPENLSEYWMNLQLTRGIKPPKVLRSPKLVKRYLQRVRGGIGYVYEHEIDETVKTIRIINTKK